MAASRRNGADQHCRSRHFAPVEFCVCPGLKWWIETVEGSMSRTERVYRFAALPFRRPQERSMNERRSKSGKRALHPAFRALPEFCCRRERQAVSRPLFLTKILEGLVRTHEVWARASPGSMRSSPCPSPGSPTPPPLGLPEGPVAAIRNLGCTRKSSRNLLIC